MHIIDYDLVDIGSAPTPLTILTGFLGAGKTTLLNRILHEDHGMRVAVIVNDFGAVNIDAELVVGVEDNVISMANGCTCCTLRDDLVATVEDTINRPDQPQFIVLEASGIADPGGIIMAFTNPRLRDRIRVDSVTCVVDADQVLDQTEHHQVTDLKLRQIAFSDMVVLNKVELAGADKVAQAHQWINHHFDNIRVFETNYCHVPREILLSIEQPDQSPGAAMRRTPTGDAVVNLAGTESDDGAEAMFDTWTFSTTKPLSLVRLREVAEGLPGGVFRCKGIVYTADLPNQPVVLQVVSRRVDLSTMPAWEGEKTTRLVVISARNSVDPQTLAEQFANCVL